MRSALRPPWDKRLPGTTLVVDGKPWTVVQDNGEGIAPDQHDRIFDLLFSTKGARGTGFGLAITKKIVEEHDGNILLDSDVGQGARFTIELPFRQTNPATVDLPAPLAAS